MTTGSLLKGAPIFYDTELSLLLQQKCEILQNSQFLKSWEFAKLEI